MLEVHESRGGRGCLEETEEWPVMELNKARCAFPLAVSSSKLEEKSSVWPIFLLNHLPKGESANASAGLSDRTSHPDFTGTGCAGVNTNCLEASAALPGKNKVSFGNSGKKEVIRIMYEINRLQSGELRQEASLAKGQSQREHANSSEP